MATSLYNVVIFIFVFVGPKHFEHGGHHYWFSGNEENFTDHKVDWLDGRNICREYCMDLVSLETPSENDMVTNYLTDSKNANSYCNILL